MQPERPHISILIPVLNEIRTIREAVRQISAAASTGMVVEVLAIDGGSTDGSWECLEELAAHGMLHRLIRQSAWGKGGAVMEGAGQAAGAVVAVFDADLEYDAADVYRVAEPVFSRAADIGLGTRTRNRLGMRRPVRWPDVVEGLPLDIGTFALETIIKIRTRAPYKDPFCMHRCWRAELTPMLPWGTPGFGWDLDMLLSAQEQGWLVAQTPVRYHPRNFSSGKKLRPYRDSMDNLRVLAQHVAFRKQR
ncbi:glycosyltransferase family 2 protein [bacterium]|nr:glycosyltransferase family 2 protein [candidate division CSSED10-310 bacterium]